MLCKEIATDMGECKYRICLFPIYWNVLENEVKAMHYDEYDDSCCDPCSMPSCHPYDCTPCCCPGPRGFQGPTGATGLLEIRGRQEIQVPQVQPGLLLSRMHSQH